MIPLSVCGRCARHVKVNEARCPFCGAGREAVAALATTPMPRGMSRALLVALGASVSLPACRTRTEGAAHPVSVEPARVDPHPTIAAPYGVPPDPNRVPTPTWLITLPDPIAMSARATTPLIISAANAGETPLETHRDRVSLRVNGVVALGFDAEFHRDVPDEWVTLAPHHTARDERRVLEALAPTPGEYLFELILDGRPIAGRRVYVGP